VGDTYSCSVTIYDSKGAPHTLTIDFTHNGLNGAGNDEWAYDVTLPGADVTGGTPGTPFSLGTGVVEFDGTGQMITPAADVTFTTPTFTNGADALTFTWDLFDDLGVPSITGYPIESSTSSTNTDGYPPGVLTSLIIDGVGLIQGVFSNGQVEPLAQLATATFNNPRGLLRLGKNLFSETNSSGGASVGAPGSGGRGTIMGSALESSNVDIATEFTSMLVFERGYQANSRIITTSDEIIQESLNLKR
jgi:flagellar hook protein FlgE